ncbi:TnpV protein [Paenibacillus alginolyticus]|uniref:TnpV protein n=2 Tax=Paenibacillus alginolyticus TaxID=59839 RepID=UPI0027D8C62A|nr:TnpV protein [Paenibacillus alginolyticus]
MHSERMRGNRFIPLQDQIPYCTMKLLDKKGRMSMELTYSPQGDYLLPNLTLSVAETTIGKYGMMRKTFLKTERKGIYAHLMLSEQLNQHLADIDRTAREQIDRTIQELLISRPAPDKASDPLAWTGHMNNLKQQAEELILTELIYH